MLGSCHCYDIMHKIHSYLVNYLDYSIVSTYSALVEFSLSLPIGICEPPLLCPVCVSFLCSQSLMDDVKFSVESEYLQILNFKWQRYGAALQCKYRSAIFHLQIQMIGFEMQHAKLFNILQGFSNVAVRC